MSDIRNHSSKKSLPNSSSSSSKKKMKATPSAAATLSVTNTDGEAIVPISASTATLNTHEQPHPLLRNVAVGMNPVTLMTGFYGPRGERIRHQVHEGALRLPQNALDLILMMPEMNKNASAVSSGGGSGDDGDQCRDSADVIKGTSTKDITTYTLPDLDAVKRPSMDVENTDPLVVTEVYNEDFVEEDISPSDGTIRTTTHTKTMIQHFYMVRPVPSGNMEGIRGGGGGDSTEDGPGTTAEDGIPTEDVVTAAATATATVAVEATSSIPPLTSVTTNVPNQELTIAQPPTLQTLPSPPPPLAVTDDASNTMAPPKESIPTPMDIDTVATTSTATPDTVVAAPAPATIPPPVLQVASTPATVMPTPADPALQQQQISNMEKALLSTIQSNSSNNLIKQTPTATVNSKANAIAARAPASAPAPVASDTRIPSTVISSMPIVKDSNMTAHQPVMVTSTTTTAPEVTTKKEIVGHVIPLVQRPPDQYETHKVVVEPTNNNNSSTATMAQQKRKDNDPAWYQSDRVAPLERAVLSEWFDGSASHRTEQSYLMAREKVIEMSNTIGPDHYLTGTMVRRSIPGDAGSLLRLHAFLTSYAMINQNAINESTPTPLVLMDDHYSNKRIKVTTTNDWNTDETLKMNLIQAVVEHSRTLKSSDGSMDWNAVAQSVGNGVTAKECEHQFLTMSIPTETKHTSNTNSSKDGLVTPDVVSIDPSNSTTKQRQQQEEWITDLVNNVDPTVLRAVTTAALSNTQSEKDLLPAQKAAIVGLILHDTVDMVEEKEEEVVQILSEVMELRMRRIEARLSTLDDVEDMLEAERVALELERRDLYTARCRHWFGGT
jgi:hypothetical protein